MTATSNDPPPLGMIGAIVPHPRRADTVRVMVQGQLLLTIPRAVALAEQLAEGQVLEATIYERLARSADEEASYRTALRCLERRPFARRDLMRRLILKGHPPEAAARAVERAERAGLVDDDQYARHFVLTRAAKGRGPLRLRRDLAALGIDRKVIDRALETLGPAGEAGPSAVQLAERRLGQLCGRTGSGRLSKPVLRRRLLGYLNRRGFVGSEAANAVQAVLDSR
ncbi:MAG: regulatory protein RecX [Gemmatimonadales bacterium]